MKLFIGSILLAVSSLTHAQTSVFLTFDTNFKIGGSGTNQELGTGLAFDTRVGKFDFALLGNRYSVAGINEALGFEVGYSRASSTKFGKFTTRGSYGRKNYIDEAGGGFVRNTNYYGFSEEFSKPLSESTTAFLEYRHRGFLSAGSENRLSTGLNLSLTKSATARIGYGYTRASGANYQGPVLSFSYKF
jgi:hypothetical protein